MIDTNKLPKSKDIFHLAQFITSYPVKTSKVVRIARQRSYNEHIIKFLKLFPADSEFQNRDDFIARCESLKILLKQEAELPEEHLLSPQDLTL